MDTTTLRIFSKSSLNHFPLFSKQLVSARMQRPQDCWYSTMLIPTIVVIEDGLLSMRLSPVMTWRLLISLWKGVPRLSLQMPMGLLLYLWQLRVGSWKLWDTSQNVVSTVVPLHVFTRLILNISKSPLILPGSGFLSLEKRPSLQRYWNPVVPDGWIVYGPSDSMPFFSIHSWSPALGRNMVLSNCIAWHFQKPYCCTHLA